MIKFFKCSNNGLVIPICNCYTDATSLTDANEITPNTVEAATKNIFQSSLVVEIR